MIHYGQQDITQADIDAVVAALTSINLTQGPKIEEFESSVRLAVGVSNAIAVNSATSALHIACMALDLKPGDRLWTSPNTFVASANCALYCGAEVDFVDIDPNSYNMSVGALEEKLMLAKREGSLPKVVVPVHYAGQSCDMQAIHVLSKKYGFRIIEDASHAIGGSYLGQPIGNCRFSDITVFSFHPVKIITTGEGGMAVTQDETLAKKLSLYRSHGITRDPALMIGAMDGPWYYEQVELGYNYRMTDIHAALGVSQMTRLKAYVDRRHAIATRYNELLTNLPLTLPWQHSDSHSAYHLYPVRVRNGEMGAQVRLEVFEKLRAKDILVNVHYIPVHTQPYYRRMGFAWGDFPQAEKFYREAISIPIHPRLTDPDIDFVSDVLREAVCK
jgi:UDP-4-amino-4,6-dideoxy-N-acetyl-beta-L-altrosamine transaminase